MTDSRYSKLAETLIQYSCELEPGEKVLIEAVDIPHEFTCELVKVAANCGAQPLVTLKNQAVWRALQIYGSQEQMRLIGDSESLRMAGVDAYIGVRGSHNVSEWSDVPREKMAFYENEVAKRVHLDLRVPATKWVVLRWPSPSMAQLAHMSTAAFEDFYFDVCTFDYAQMSVAMEPLRDLMNATDRVRLVAPGTDLEFSIRDIPAVLCDGHRNIPDGEVFTAPVRDSINGSIQYNTPTIYQGVSHENVRLVFKDGKITESESSQSRHLERVLDTDQGSRYVGEFAIGFHPQIRKPMKDILFDEKIAGSIHLTPGQCYKEASNGNQSQIHWDLVLMMNPEAGGGEIYFDGRLVRKDGLFVVDELQDLNPDRLIV